MKGQQDKGMMEKKEKEKKKRAGWRYGKIGGKTKMVKRRMKGSHNV